MLWHDFVRFCRLQLTSQDVDPMYPVLEYLYRGMEHEQALWHTVLYVGYYSIASATQVFDKVPHPALLPASLAKLPTGVERRNFRDGSIVRHIDYVLALVAHYGSLEAWLTHNFTDDYVHNWKRLQDTLQMPYGNGRWASYKTAEILQKAHHYPLQPTDMGLAFSTGPRWGLALFCSEVKGNSKEDIKALETYGQQLRVTLLHFGVEMGIEQLETMLCDFHALYDGNYYVGHDIDQMQEQIVRAELETRLALPLYQARAATLAYKYLGEEQGWNGIDRERKLRYKQKGVVLDRDE